MKCDNCGKEETWLQVIGSNFICSRCVQKHKIMGLVFRTHLDLFKSILKKLKVKDYPSYMNLERNEIESVVDLRKNGIKLKTTNVIEL